MHVHVHVCVCVFVVTKGERVADIMYLIFLGTGRCHSCLLLDEIPFFCYYFFVFEDLFIWVILSECKEDEHLDFYGRVRVILFSLQTK